jgi:hypothetical protein
MPATTRLTHAFFGRKTLAALGAAAALAGTGVATAGAASAATTSTSPAHAPVTNAVTTAAITHGTGTGANTGASLRTSGVPATAPSVTSTPASLNSGPGQSPFAPAHSAPANAAPSHGGGSNGGASNGAANNGAANNGASAGTAPAAAPAQHSTGPNGSAPQAAPAAAPAKPYQMYDSVTPSHIPSGHAVATYADGPYKASGSEVSGRGDVTWIDTNGSDPRANVLDVEPGDATPSSAATWTWHKLHASPNATAILYTMRSEWGAVQSAVHHLPQQMQSHVRYWIADPTGVPHVVPGSSATQWYWGPNYDISTCNPGF